MIDKIMYCLQFILQSLAGWTFAFNDYYDLNITVDIDSLNLTKMGQIIDPYSKSLLFTFVIDIYIYICRLFGTV
jgi:PhoPQ-activated pathogenicity-related protein